jgi:hypothetical protein
VLCFDRGSALPLSRRTRISRAAGGLTMGASDRARYGPHGSGAPAPKQPRHDTHRAFRPREAIDGEIRQRPQELRPPAPLRMSGGCRSGYAAPGSHLLLRPASTDSPRNRRPADQHREAMEGLVERRQGARRRGPGRVGHRLPAFVFAYQVMHRRAAMNVGAAGRGP